VVWQAAATHEAIAFAPVGPLAPRRGPAGTGQLGLTYVHQASDATSGRVLFREPGTWLHVPSRIDQRTQGSVARLATLPEDRAVLADGTWRVVIGPPVIGSRSPVPRDLTTRQPVAFEEGLGVAKMPDGVAATAGRDPNALLRERIAGQEITRTTVLAVTARPGIEQCRPNAPDAVVNPVTLSLHATFWIETIAERSDTPHELLQLQYSEMVVVEVDGVGWPHISVATLRQQRTLGVEGACSQS